MTNSTLLALLELLLQRGKRQMGVSGLSNKLVCRVGGVHASKVSESHGIGPKGRVWVRTFKSLLLRQSMAFGVELCFSVPTKQYLQSNRARFRI